MRYTAAGLVLLLVVLLTCSGCGPTSAKAKDPTDIGAYVENAKKLEAETQRNEGSLWTSNAYRSNLFRDSKARYINDIVTIRVLETTQAVASADAKNSKETSASSGFDNLFGLEKAIKELPTTVSGKGSSSFEEDRVHKPEHNAGNESCRPCHRCAAQRVPCGGRKARSSCKQRKPERLSYRRGSS
jgi:flagellar L-ring protein precursor FlgH